MQDYCVNQSQLAIRTSLKKVKRERERDCGALWAARIDELIDCRRQKSRGESLTTSVEVDKYMCTLDLKVAERKLDQYHVYVIAL